MKEIKNWSIEYNHNDGRNGTVEAVTEVGESGAFAYGNRKYGTLTVGEFTQGYDLRYSTEKDLHMVMLKEYFGDGLVKATEIDWIYCMAADNGDI